MKSSLLPLAALILSLGASAPLRAADPAVPAEKAAPSASLADPSKLTEKAPDSFKVKFTTTKGDFTLQLSRPLSPNGADRFYNLVKAGYFKDIAFFRVIPGFMGQFGIHGDPIIAAAWRTANIPDDTVKGSNVRGAITFAKSGAPNSRSTQFFINLADNANLDGMGFSPFGKVVEGMDVVDKLNGEYGINGLYIGVPVIIGAGGVEKIIEIELNAEEKKMFDHSVGAVKDLLGALDKKAA